MTPKHSSHPSPTEGLTRRHFLGGALVAGAAISWFQIPIARAADALKPATFDRKIKLGVIGNGGRGAWIANLFKRHGGYEMWAVADYFQEVADACGDVLGVDKSRRFSTLSGYKRLIESGGRASRQRLHPRCGCVALGHGDSSGGGRRFLPPGTTKSARRQPRRLLPAI